MKRTSIGIGIFAICEKKLLLLLRDDKPDILWPGTWSLIGGAIEPGETPFMTARRELKEEIDRNCELSYLGTHHAPKLKDRKTFYQVNLKKPIDFLGEGCDYDYFTIEDLKDKHQLGKVKGGLGGAMQTIFMKYPEAIQALLNGDSEPIKKIPEFGGLT